VGEVVGVNERVPVEHEVAEGAIAEQLVARAHDAELLVVGSRGRGGFRGLVLGSVGQQCARHTPCPLVIVRHAAAGPETEAGGPPTIVVGVDGSPNADAALDWAFAEAAGRGARVVALLAWSPRHGHELSFAGAGDDALEAKARVVLHEAVARADRRGVECTEVAEEGSAACLLAEASKHAQLLVVGTRGRRGFTGLMLGSVAQQCVHHAPGATVVVPAASPR
jgi:nucleotide-binding universal stress UspA family protein